MDNAANELRRRLDQIPRNLTPSGAILNRCLNEAWFSDSLAWLLNPQGDHGFGVELPKALVRRIAKIRCSDVEYPYRRRATTLRWGRSGPGVTPGRFSFKNAAVVREFYLTRLRPRQSRPVQRFCDLVFLDLDSRDGFFLVVENKLFSGEHDDQLRQYRLAVEEKFSRAKVREYVYLTLAGAPPNLQKKRAHENLHWVRASWVDDILKVLRDAQRAKPDRIPSAQLTEIDQVLRWLRYLVRIQREYGGEIRALRESVVVAAADCLLLELQRLGEGRRGSWSRRSKRGGRVKLVHSSRPAGVLNIDTLPGMTVAVEGRTSGRAAFEKLLVPFGAHADQVFNLLDVSARDIYYLHFERPELYLGAARRLRTTKSAPRTEHEPLFRFLHDYRHPLKVLLSL